MITAEISLTRIISEFYEIIFISLKNDIDQTVHANLSFLNNIWSCSVLKKRLKMFKINEKIEKMIYVIN